MGKDDLVRGKKRQRRKTPKTKSGCVTCRIRRIKCDERKPSCNKCTSTGRKCDGYIQACAGTFQEPIAEREPYPAAPGNTSHPIVCCGVSRYTGIAEHEQNTLLPYEHSNKIVTPPLFPFGFASNHLPGRAFHYFIHRSAADLTGPLHAQVWREFVLSVCGTSPAIQHGIVALSGLHERYCFPIGSFSDEQCWRQYYLAVRSTNKLVENAAQDGEEMSAATTVEILVSCIIFTSIEILLGNTNAALRYLESGLSLIRTHLTKGSTPLPQIYDRKANGKITSADKPPSSPTLLDPRTIDLIGWFARMDLQILSFSPSHHNSTSKPTYPPQYAILEIPQPLPNAPSTSLYRIMKQGLYWIRHHATPFKYSSDIPQMLYQSQTNLLTALSQWRTIFLDWQNEEFPFKAGYPDIAPDRAHLLLTYHLTALKVRTALSPTETIFGSTKCTHAFSAILYYAFVILRQRNARLGPIVSPQDETRREFFFSLESSIVEALYVMTLKCRNPVSRRCSLGMLKGAGREGVWDGAVMAEVARHVISLEEGRRVHPGRPSPEAEDGMPNCNLLVIRKLAVKLNVISETTREVEAERARDPGKEVAENCMVHTVQVDIDRTKRSVEVECGWFVEKERRWRHERVILEWRGRNPNDVIGSTAFGTGA